MSFVTDNLDNLGLHYTTAKFVGANGALYEIERWVGPCHWETVEGYPTLRVALKALRTLRRDHPEHGYRMIRWWVRREASRIVEVGACTIVDG